MAAEGFAEQGGRRQPLQNAARLPQLRVAHLVLFASSSRGAILNPWLIFLSRGSPFQAAALSGSRGWLFKLRLVIQATASFLEPRRCLPGRVREVHCAV